MGTSRREFDALSPEEQLERLGGLAREALPRFGLAADSGLTLLKHRENAVYRVVDSVTGERFALRVHREGYQTAASIQSELIWMQALRDGGVLTPEARPGTDGQWVQAVTAEAVAGLRHCDVLSWIEGEPLDPESSIDSFRLLGELHARLHRQARAWSLPPGFERHRWDESGMLGDDPLWGRYSDLEALAGEARELLDRAKTLVVRRLREFGAAEDRFGLIHADFMPENVLLADGEAYVIDFDDCGFGWNLYDPATLFAFSVTDPAYPAMLDAWTEGYRSVLALPGEHLAMLEILIMARMLVGLGWLHTRRETDMARDMTGAVVELACYQASRLLDS